MAKININIITMEDMGMAYRKAKVDLYYSSNPDLMALLEYEEDLFKNLTFLRKRISEPSTSWVHEPDFLGKWVLVPREIKVDDPCPSLICSDADSKWNVLCEGLGDNKPNAEFRLMAKPSIDFHVLSALWMIKAGGRYDKQLDDCAYGNRLRRKKKDGPLDKLAIGSFLPYLHPFRKWKSSGIDVMKNALEGEKKIVAITADVTSFYHELSPDFLLDPYYLSKLGFKSPPCLTSLFVEALNAWAETTPHGKGLPVGLPASGVVANMALIELDRIIQKEVVPLYYGRYVDDIILVMENSAGFKNLKDVWEWIFKRSEGLLGWSNNNGNAKDVKFTPSYLAHSQIEFSNDKNKVFILEGERGLRVVNSLAQQIHERASEWRALPDLPSDPKAVAGELLSATQLGEEPSLNLREVDGVSLNRVGFAIKLRDIEAYERDIPPSAWRAQRKAFLKAFIQHTMVLPAFFELAQYLPRVIQLATSCEDYAELAEILERMGDLKTRVRDDCTLSIKACDDLGSLTQDELCERWDGQIDGTLTNYLISAFPAQLSSTGRTEWQEQSTFKKFDPEVLCRAYKRLFEHDLAYTPFRYCGLRSELSHPHKIPAGNLVFTEKDCPLLVDRQIADTIPILSSRMELGDFSLPYALLFPNRPFSIQELYLLNGGAFTEHGKELINAFVGALRGYSAGDKLPSIDACNCLHVLNRRKATKIKVAIVSWATSEESWNASVLEGKDPDTTRYRRLNGVLNSVLKSPVMPDYVILPELSIPPRWFMSIAHKLHGKGISLISGVEYLHSKPDRVSNQVWAALSHDGLGYPSMMVYRQDKQHPAPCEEVNLESLGGRVLVPLEKWDTPPVIRHGDFHLAMLICSELTNIVYRTALRGKIDALFVPEWNKDTETFNALVESAALDIHAFVIQCNDRQYGDSRIRAPYKDSWLRDLVRLKGGLNDYFVVGEIDVDALRQFQSQHRSPTGPFKPVPDGFLEDMADERKVLPRGEKNDG